MVDDLGDKQRRAARRLFGFLLGAALAGIHAGLVVLRLVFDDTLQAAHVAHPLVDAATPRIFGADTRVEDVLDGVQRTRLPTVERARQAERFGGGIGQDAHGLALV